MLQSSVMSTARQSWSIVPKLPLANMARQYATTSDVVSKKPRKAAAPKQTPVKALKTPTSNSRVSAYTLFIQNFAAERKKAGEKFLLQNATEAYKALPESEKSKLLEQLPELIAQRRAIYNEFISKLSPSEIATENKTRAALRKSRIAAGKSVKNLGPIVDPNAPTRPLGAYFRFAQEMRNDFEYEGMTLTEQAKALGQKWKTLSDSEKSRFTERAQKEQQEYLAKKKQYYGES